MVGIVVVAVLLNGGRARDRIGAERQHREEVGERILVDDADRVLVDDDDAGEVAVAELQAAGAGLIVVLMARIRVAIDVELHGLRVERRAIVKPDALTQLESVGPRIGRDLPRGGEIADQRLVRLDGHVAVDETVVEIVQQRARHRTAIDVVVEGAGLRLPAADQRSAGLRRGGGGAGGARGKKRSGRPKRDRTEETATGNETAHGHPPSSPLECQPMAADPTPASDVLRRPEADQPRTFA